MYTITTIEVRKNWDGSKEEISSHIENRGLKFETIERAEALCQELGIQHYEINDVKGDGCFDSKVVKKLQSVINIETRYTQEKKEFQEKQQKRVEEINAMPTEYSFKTYTIGGKEVRFFFERCKAEFQPNYSSRIQGGGVRLFMTTESWKENKDIWVSGYFAKGGKVLRKKFQTEMLEQFTDWRVYRKELLTQELIDLVAPIVNDLEEMKKRYDELNKQTQ